METSPPLPHQYRAGSSGTEKPAGMYVHVPFCLRKCPYCDFYSVTGLSLLEDYLRALVHEMALRAPEPAVFDTLYIGGGTPSVLSEQNIGAIIDAAFRRFRFSKDVEVTLEVNPGTADAGRIRGYLAAGVNRLSIGIQSFQDANLSFLGRIHSASQAEAAIRWARDAGCTNLGLDLIYGLPGQRIASWKKDLKRALDFKPEHLSGYMLTLEPGTPLAGSRDRGEFKTPPETAVGRQFETTIDYLGSRGYEHYEISNFAADRTLRSRHNQKYWTDAVYLGFGPSAHSYRNPIRAWNHRDMERYLADVKAGKPPVAGDEVLSRDQQMMEAVYLGLRCSDGIDLDAFRERFSTDFGNLFAPLADQLKADGFLGLDDTRCTLTRRGMLFLDHIAGRFAELI